MMNSIKMKYNPFAGSRGLLTIMGLLISGAAFSQTISNDFQTRTEVTLQYKPLENLSLALNPEIRWDESFSVSRYMIETKLAYEPLKGLTFGGSYRFVVNPRESRSTEYLHRFALQAGYKIKINRFTPSLRVKYTNYTEDVSLGEFLRYRGKLEYNIRKCKLTPMASAEAFQELSSGQIYKVRYGVGAQYKFNKKNSVELGYLLDYYMLEYRNKHIIKLGYKYKF